MTKAGEFVDATLRRESDPGRAGAEMARLGGELSFYGASVGAVRGTVRDALHRHRNLTHDDITALSSELWAAPVFERRLAAIVLLQSAVRMLDNSDLTRIEGFVRAGHLPALVDLLAVGVVKPLLGRLDPPARARADRVLDRWSSDGDAWLRRAELLARP